LDVADAEVAERFRFPIARVVVDARERRQFGAGAGDEVGKDATGELTGYGDVGWLAAAFTLVAIALAFRIHVVDARDAATPA